MRNKNHVKQQRGTTKRREWEMMHERENGEKKKKDGRRRNEQNTRDREKKNEKNHARKGET